MCVDSDPDVPALEAVLSPCSLLSEQISCQEEGYSYLDTHCTGQAPLSGTIPSAGKAAREIVSQQLGCDLVHRECRGSGSDLDSSVAFLFFSSWYKL